MIKWFVKGSNDRAVPKHVLHKGDDVNTGLSV